MNTSKHTQSPWTIRERKGNACFSDNAIECLIKAGTGNAFCSVALGGNAATSCQPEDVRANARLIASSPDLLSELQTEETWIANLIGDCEASRLLKPEVIAENLRARLKSIRETISKATTN